MSSGIEFEDRGFQSGFSSWLGELDRMAEAKVAEFSFSIANSAKRKCPVQTGRLRSSIGTMRAGRDARGAYADVGSNVTYAIYVDMGTYKMTPRPYLRPAFMESGLTPTGGGI